MVEHVDCVKFLFQVLRNDYNITLTVLQTNILK